MPRVGKTMDRKRNARRAAHNGAMAVAEWNSKHPVGTAVRYWPVLPPVNSMPPTDTVTRSEAWALGDGTAVVLIEGRSGGVALSHVEIRQ